MSSHIVTITTIKVQLFGNLVIGKIQSHERKAQYPHFEGLVISGKNGSGEIIEVFSALFAFIALYIIYHSIIEYQGLDIYLHMSQIPYFVLFKFAKIVIYAGPWWKIIRQVSPLALGMNQVKDLIYNFL